jgi:hypothetical protein
MSKTGINTHHTLYISAVKFFFVITANFFPQQICTVLNKLAMYTQATSYVSAVMFFFFAITVNFILINVFLTIILDGYANNYRFFFLKGQCQDFFCFRFFNHLPSSP